MINYTNTPILLLYTSPIIILTFTVPKISVGIDSDGILCQATVDNIERKANYTITVNGK